MEMLDLVIVQVVVEEQEVLDLILHQLEEGQEDQGLQQIFQEVVPHTQVAEVEELLQDVVIQLVEQVGLEVEEQEELEVDQQQLEEQQILEVVEVVEEDKQDLPQEVYKQEQQAVQVSLS
jgi:2'-5' RNA ligase